ncbi:MAG: PHB depolymerase family esterase [bacterium]
MIIACSPKYPDCKPGAMLSGEVTFAAENGKEKIGHFVYSVPLSYDSKTSWPLIITLHGYGSNALAFHDLWKTVTDTMGFVLLTPQGDVSVENNFGWTWGDDSERLILTCLELISQEIHIDPDRVYLAGFSAGGRLTYYLGLKYSHIFRGLATLSAPFKEAMLSGNNIRDRSLRIYIGYGAMEEKISRQAIKAKSILEKKGFTVKAVGYAGVGHGLPHPQEKELSTILKYLEVKE